MFFHTHTHSEFSCLDGMASVAKLADKAASMGQPGLALTDHGNMSGTFELYRECRKNDIKPFMGLEAYVVDNIGNKQAKRHHLTLIAYNTTGYKNLAALSSLSHQRDHFHRKPLLGHLDLVQAKACGATDGIACLTGCFFGELCQAIVAEPSEDLAVAHASRVLAFWRSVFDPVFVEVQHHHTDHDEWDDDRLVRALYRLSVETGCPPIITNDCHYCDKADKGLHDMMKSIAYSADVGDVSFPGDSYHLASEPWVRTHYRNHSDVWEASQGAYTDLLEMHDLRIPTLDKYQYFVPEVADDPDSALRKICLQKLQAKGLGGDYRSRLDDELSTVAGLGMANYFLLVHDYVDWCETEGIFVMARGSAAGSLICWLLGFTQVDPLMWNLSFDRFLTPDRVRPPDIDLDIEDVRRPDVIEYLKGRYEVVQIGTYNQLSYDEETGRGGLFVQFMAAQRKILGDKFTGQFGQVKSLIDLDSVDPDASSKLRKLGGEALRRSPGAHAAGFVVAAPPGHSISSWLPTMLIASSNTTVTQMMMDDVEDAGYIKIDLLGLRSLTTVSRTLELIGKDGLGWIPLDDKQTFAMLRKGRVDTGVFQFEGWTAARGCRELKVKSVADLILVNALYRPATMDSGYVDMFIKNKSDTKSVTYPHDIFRKHLEETYGVPCYQEQILGVLRDLGMPAAELNDFLKAVKGKHAKGGYSATSTKIFEANQSRFMGLCASAGMDEPAASQAWELIEGFAAYGFNRAHATAYGLLGYQMAYLKVHHPVEFHAALLETTVGSQKESAYVAETRRVKIPVLGACVNRSGVSWKVDETGKGVRRGLSSVKGVGAAAASAIVAAAPFESIDDLIERTPAKAVTGGKSWAKDRTLVGVLAALQKAGALRTLESAR